MLQSSYQLSGAASTPFGAPTAVATLYHAPMQEKGWWSRCLGKRTACLTCSARILAIRIECTSPEAKAARPCLPFEIPADAEGAVVVGAVVGKVAVGHHQGQHLPVHIFCSWQQSTSAHWLWQTLWQTAACEPYFKTLHDDETWHVRDESSGKRSSMSIGTCLSATAVSCSMTAAVVPCAPQTDSSSTARPPAPLTKSFCGLD